MSSAVCPASVLIWVLAGRSMIIDASFNTEDTVLLEVLCDASFVLFGGYETEMLTHNQKLLREYLKVLKFPPAKGLYILGILWEEEATFEMLQYIAETREADHETLLSTAEGISKKYKSET